MSVQNETAAQSPACIDFKIRIDSTELDAMVEKCEAVFSKLLAIRDLFNASIEVSCNTDSE